MSKKNEKTTEQTAAAATATPVDPNAELKALALRMVDQYGVRCFKDVSVQVDDQGFPILDADGKPQTVTAYDFTVKNFAMQEGRPVASDEFPVVTINKRVTLKDAATGQAVKNAAGRFVWQTVRATVTVDTQRYRFNPLAGDSERAIDRRYSYHPDPINNPGRTRFVNDVNDTGALDYSRWPWNLQKMLHTQFNQDERIVVCDELDRISRERNQAETAAKRQAAQEQSAANKAAL